MLSIGKFFFMKTNELPDLLSLKQACVILSCHPNTLRNWEEKGLIKAVRFGVRRDRRYRKAEVLRLVDQNESTEDVAAKLLPTSYDLSRIDMTGTHYEGIEGSAVQQFHGYDDLDKQVIPGFDFKAFTKAQAQHIQYFEEHELRNFHTLEGKILHIITANRYRNGSLELINLSKHQGQFLAKIHKAIVAKQPIPLMLPAFPFKVANPLKSLRGDADLAEVGTFTKFNEVHLQIKKLYEPGVRFVVFHDGHIYYRHFLHQKADADRYYGSLKRFVHEMGLDDIIDIRDVNEELKNISEFSTAFSEARKEMTNLWQKEGRNNEKVQHIIESAKNNVGLSAIPFEILYKVTHSPEWDLSIDELKVKREINQRAEKCAFEYMVVQQALERCNFFDRRVPGGIRLTVHPKEGQIGFYLVKRKTHLLPWMGVGVLKNNGAISVHYESELLSNGKYYPVFIKGEKFPFYYKEAEIVYQGKEEFQRFFDTILKNLGSKDFYWAFAFGTEYAEAEVRTTLANVHKTLAKKHIEDRVICRPENFKVITETYSGNKNIQIQPRQAEMPNGVIILKNRVINLLWGEKPSAFEITTPEIVQRYHNYFLELWTKSSKK